MPLEIDAATGLLKDVRQVLSPHCDARPAGVAPDLIVIHGISLPPGEFGGPWIDALFTGGLPAGRHPYFEAIRSLRVSSHALIRRDGSISQYVPFGGRAWHAGVSEFAGRTACNDFSIGIELVGDEHHRFTERQYARLASTVATLRRRYRLRFAVGHADIAPGRKIDPGPFFDWNRVLAMPAFAGLERPPPDATGVMDFRNARSSTRI